MVVTILLTIVMLLLSAFFSGCEIAFISANKLSVEVLKNKGHRQGVLLGQLYEKPDAVISTLLVGNNIALVILTILFSSLLDPIIGLYVDLASISGLLVTTAIITIVVLIFGEFLPKTLFRLFSSDILLKLVYPMRFFMWLLYVPTVIMTATSSLFLKYFLKTPTEASSNALSRIDLEHYIHANVTGEEDIDKEILTNALNLNTLKVRDCMVPRNEIIYVDRSESIGELTDLFRTHKISRIIVVDGDIENVLGYIHHQQLFQNPKKIDKLIMPIMFVPDAMQLQELMYQFIKERSNIACIVDEFGGVSGLITLEDILEEIFGEIEDEHDDEGLFEEQISENEFVFSGRLEIDYLNEKYPILQLLEGEYHTLSGLIVMNEARIPEQGDEVVIGSNRFILEGVSETKIEKVRLVVDAKEKN